MANSGVSPCFIQSSLPYLFGLIHQNSSVLGPFYNLVSYGLILLQRKYLIFPGCSILVRVRIPLMKYVFTWFPSYSFPKFLNWLSLHLLLCFSKNSAYIIYFRTVFNFHRHAHIPKVTSEKDEYYHFPQTEDIYPLANYTIFSPASPTFKCLILFNTLFSWFSMCRLVNLQCFYLFFFFFWNFLHFLFMK